MNTEPARLSARATAALRQLGEVTEVEADRAFLLERTASFDALFIGLRQPIDRAILNAATSLKCIVTPTTGLNHIDQDAASSKRVTILSLRGETAFLQNVTATAELTWGLLLALIRHIPQASASVLSEAWDRERFRGNELRNKTLGIVGYGRLGRMVASYALAFRMSVVAYDNNHDASISDSVRYVSLEELLSTSDVVSIHLPLTPETTGFIGTSQLDLMKRGALLLNTARGEILDEGALVNALVRGHLAGAAVDVLNNETSLDAKWLSSNRLVRYAMANSNLLITPHIGGATQESAELTNLFMIEKLHRFIRNWPDKT